ncbi:MAG: hypothetical protein IVW57_12970 [Ktedonobacterales bacterium]|nr:hypothetical protein [Ktedonobacterales bacterium]
MTSQRDEIQMAAPADLSAVAATSGPRGIGTAVSFDWGIGFELLILAPYFVAGTGPGSSLIHQGTMPRLGAGLLTLGLAAGAFALGEGMRRGWRPAWAVQVVLNSAITLGGLATLPAAVSGLRSGHFGQAVATSIMLFISPAIAWMLTRPATRAWLARTTSAAARARHGGAWLIGPLLCAVIGGAAIAFQRAY